MSRLLMLPLAALLCAATAQKANADAHITEVSREHVSADIYHYTFVVKVGEAANARLRMHRVVRELAPWFPRPTAAGVMLLHGDFATFTTSFADGMAPYLAARDIDAWGVDRRWTNAAPGGDISDLGAMGFAQETADIGDALQLARVLRLATGSGYDRMTLAGFSRGGQLAYAYAVLDAGRPASQRQLKTLVPLDVYAAIPPEDGDAKAWFCEGAAFERDLVAQGVIDADNLFIIDIGALALSDPDATSPYFGKLTNLGALRKLAEQTYLFFPATPVYHLNMLRETPAETIATWFASAPPHQSLRESADGDTLWCGEGPLPVPYDLGRIKVPLFYLGAAGGFGDHGLYTTTLVGSREVKTLVVRRFGPEGEAQDFGHADLLFATDAPTLAWQPLAAWILEHR